MARYKTKNSGMVDGGGGDDALLEEQEETISLLTIVPLAGSTDEVIFYLLCR
jgi:hypothetical protein